MAVMHPSHIPSNKPGSEIRFFEACRDQLTDKFHVFYSVRWYTTLNGKREDSECDFLVFNPDYGFLCIEVKGGTGITIDNDIWHLEDHYGGRYLKRSPYLQAEESMRFFKSYYEDELEAQYSGIYGCAVAFPNFSVQTPLTVSSPLEMTIDLDDMTNLAKRITEIFRYFRGKRSAHAAFLPPDAQRKFIQIINKRVALSIAAGALIQDKEVELERINQTQETIIDLLTHYPRAFIVGGAGTGKTWIGIKKVVRCVRGGKRALYLCYNKALAEAVRAILPDCADCYNIDSLMYSILQDKALQAPEKNGTKEYGDLLIESPDIPKYDLIVVDEAQDFSEDWAFCVNLLIKDKASLYVLCDESQNIFGRSFGDKFLIEERPFVLRYNIRNTANIYRYSQEHTALGLDTIANQIEGVEPEERKFSRKAQAIAYLDSIVNKLVNREGVSAEKIVILSNRRKENSILSGVTTVGTYDIVDNKNGQKNNAISYRTIQGFKGLESDIVIFVNHTYKNEPKTDEIRAMLYTAMTRARFYLYIVNFEDNGLV